MMCPPLLSGTTTAFDTATHSSLQAVPATPPTHLLDLRFMTLRNSWSADSMEVFAASSMAPNSAPTHSPTAPISAHTALELASSARLDS